MTSTALLLAAGMGTRLQYGAPKAFVPISGKPMLLFGLEAMERCGVIDHVVVVVPPSLVADARRLVPDWAGSRISHEVVEGGTTRADSVRRGLDAVPPAMDTVVCHDAARPFASPELFTRTFEALQGVDGVVPVVRSADTVKRLDGGRIVETIARDSVGLAQTPQTFRAECLRSVHQASRSDHAIDATDDAMLLESAGFRVVAVDGEPENFKITKGEDLRRAESLVHSGALQWLRSAEDSPQAPRRSP